MAEPHKWKTGSCAVDFTRLDRGSGCLLTQLSITSDLIRTGSLRRRLKMLPLGHSISVGVRDNEESTCTALLVGTGRKNIVCTDFVGSG